MRERVQVNGPQGPQAIRPVATPNISAIQERREAPSKGLGGQLASALSAIQPDIQKHLDDRQTKFQEDEAVRAYDTIQGMTFDEAKSAVDSGRMKEGENPWFDAAFRKQFGIVFAGKRKREILDAYANGFDPETGDIEEFLTGFVNEDASAYGHDQFVSAGIRDGMGTFLTTLRDKNAEDRSGIRTGKATQGFLDVARETAFEAISKGANVSDAVRALYGQHRDLLGLSFKEMDGMTLSLAEELAAAGDEASVRQLLETEVIGSDGQQVGSFLTRAGTADNARRIIAQAEANRVATARSEYVGGMVKLKTAAATGALTDVDKAVIQSMIEAKTITPAAGEAILVANITAIRRATADSQEASLKTQYEGQVGALMLSGGNVNMVEDYTYIDANGTEKTFKAKDAIQGTIDSTLENMAGSGYSISQLAGTLAGFGVENTYGGWERTLTNGHLSLSAALAQVEKDGTFALPAPAAEAYELWKSMGEYPRLRARHIKDGKALRIYQDAEIFERTGIADAETSLLMAARVPRDVTGNGISSRIETDRLDSAIGSATDSGGWLWGLFGGEEATNAGTVGSTVERLARGLMAGGLGAQDAVKEAGKLFSESHTIINGSAVNTRNLLIPPHFEQSSAFIIADFAANHGADPDDLTLLPSHSGENAWFIADKRTMWPHPEWAQGGSLTMAEIGSRWEAVEAARAAKAMGDRNLEIREEAMRRNAPTPIMDVLRDATPKPTHTPSELRIPNLITLWNDSDGANLEAHLDEVREDPKRPALDLPNAAAWARETGK